MSILLEQPEKLEQLLQTLKALIKLVDDNKLAVLEVSGIKIAKAMHKAERQETKIIPNVRKTPETEEELLFWSADDYVETKE